MEKIKLKYNEVFDDLERQNAVLRLLNAFPGSFINYNKEIILHPKTNQYFILHNCETVKDIDCKVLEWLSRPSYKTCPYKTDNTNNKFHQFMRNGVNEYLGTNFSEKDMDIIYTYLGNAINHNLTIKFIDSGYDFSLLKD